MPTNALAQLPWVTAQLLATRNYWRGSALLNHRAVSAEAKHRADDGHVSSWLRPGSSLRLKKCGQNTETSLKRQRLASLKDVRRAAASSRCWQHLTPTCTCLVLPVLAEPNSRHAAAAPGMAEHRPQIQRQAHQRSIKYQTMIVFLS